MTPQLCPRASVMPSIRHALLLYIGAALCGTPWAVLADTSSIPTCSLEQLCPESSPCCSQYGQCGVGAYCLGGCDPRMSFSLDSCVPAPVCQDRVMPMNSLDRIVDESKYLGDPSTADWVSQGHPIVYDGNVLLTMPAQSVGTNLASTVYMWYGNVTASLRTSRGPGVVTAFILFSDVKDEIDYEFVGTELTIAQSNYYVGGRPYYVNSGNMSLSDTFNNFHEYQIQWTPDSITWLIDGQVGRVKYRKDTWNETSQGWDFPQTPSRVQLSLWPGGASSNQPGTITWAGGPIDWNSPDIQANGYDYAVFGQVSMSCYQTNTPPGTNSGVSYTYNSVSATNSSVVNGNKPTVLKSFQGSGRNMNAGAPAASASASASATQSSSASGTATLVAPPPSATAAEIPGGANTGPGSDPSSNTDATAAAAAPSASTTCDASNFNQKCAASTSGTTSAAASHRLSMGWMIGGAAVAVACLRPLLA